jgi:hypothetical protein
VSAPASITTSCSDALKSAAAALILAGKWQAHAAPYSPVSGPALRDGFVVGTGEDFLAFLKAQAATDPQKPHPWPIEAFLGGHPRALKFAQDPKPTPVSFATEAFYGNNALRFVNDKGQKQIGGYRIVPVAGP